MPRDITHEWDPSCPFCAVHERQEELRADNDRREVANSMKLHKDDEPDKFDRRREKTPSWAVDTTGEEPSWAKPGTNR